MEDGSFAGNEVGNGVPSDSTQAGGALEPLNELMQNEYAFECTLNAAIRVRAKSRHDAEALLRRVVDSADCNGGAWPNGDPLLF